MNAIKGAWVLNAETGSVWNQYKPKSENPQGGSQHGKQEVL